MRRFGCDEAKRQKVMRERGVDLIALAAIFRNPEDLVIRLDGRTEYGEHRFQAIGRIVRHISSWPIRSGPGSETSSPDGN